MMQFKHFHHRKIKKLTFMIIPNSTGKVIQFSLPIWTSFAIIGFAAFLFITTIAFSSGFWGHNHQLTTAKQTIAQLEEKVLLQQAEIDELKNYSSKVEEKLADLAQLENQVLSMVGLEIREKNLSKPQNEPAFNTLSLPSLSVSRSSLGFSFNDRDLKEEINFLTEIIDQKKEHMKQLIEDVEEQLAYIDALPNLRPAPGRVSSPFGYRTSPFGRSKEFHQGMDISNQPGTEIVAAGSGIVTYSGHNGGYGKVVILSHGHGYSSIYAHNQQNLVSVGDKIEKGQVIAKMGSTGRSTGPHVHFEVRLNNQPIDPMELLKE